MIRFYFTCFVLLCVILVGLPFGYLKRLSYEAYYWTRYIGIDVAMQPMTFDMSMMTSSTGENVYEKNMSLTSYALSTKIVVLPENADLHTLKIPIILYMEMLSHGVDVIESRYAICKGLQKQTGLYPEKFILNISWKPGYLKMDGFNVYHKCP